MIKEKAVFLDAGSMGDDLDLAPLHQLLPELSLHPQTDATEIIQRIADARIVIVNKVKLGKPHFEAAKHLKLIILAATGSDNIDIRAAAAHGITVCNVKGYSIDSVPQHALTLMLMLATRIDQYAEDVKQGCWSRAQHFSLLSHPITQLKAKTLLIVGYGSLGQQLEKLVAPFNMKVQLCNIPGRQAQAGRPDFDSALAEADFVSLHCPLSAHTQKLIAQPQLKRMKSTAFLINTARGQLIDDESLVQALRSGQIAGAGIDVLSHEPPDSNHPLLAADIPNLILTPHNAWGAVESRQLLLEGMVTNIQSFFSGKPVNTVTAD